MKHQKVVNNFTLFLIENAGRIFNVPMIRLNNNNNNNNSTSNLMSNMMNNNNMAINNNNNAPPLRKKPSKQKRTITDEHIRLVLMKR